MISFYFARDCTTDERDTKVTVGELGVLLRFRQLRHVQIVPLIIIESVPEVWCGVGQTRIREGHKFLAI